MTHDNRDTLVAQLVALEQHTRAVVAHAQAVLAQHPSVWPPKRNGRTPDEMEPGGWVRFPGTHTWRQIVEVRRHGALRHICYRFGGVDYSEWADRATTLDYLTDAEFQADCDRRQAQTDEAIDRLDFAEWQAKREAS